MAQAIDPEKTLSKLTLEEKIALLSGNDTWHTHPVPRLGIPRVRCSDGPNGVRGISWLNSAASACFPCATGTGSSFDIDLVKRIGAALGAECRVRGAYCLLGPTTNIQRDPRGGRGFESFGEDPYHSGLMALAWIQGVQSQGVMTNLVCNEQEINRRSTNSVLDRRTLHEIYLEPFRLQCKGNPKTFDILRRDFRFDGMVISDWGGTYSSSEAIKATMDLEMPGPGMMRGASIERDICSGKLHPDDVDACVLRILKFVRTAQLSGIPFEAVEETIDSPVVRSLMAEAAAASVVLLKNERATLPLAIFKGQMIAVIGPNANVACISGGGSASLTPTYKVTPLAAIQSAATSIGATVETCLGADISRWTPLLNDMIVSEDGVAGGMSTRFYSENPFGTAAPDCLHSMVVNGTYAVFVDGIPSHVPTRGYVQAIMAFTPTQTGVWILGLTVAGQGELFVDGQVVVENATNQKADVTFFNTGAEERLGEIELEAGKQYRLEVRFSNFQQISAMSPYAGRRGAMRVGGKLKRSAQDEIDRAVELVERSNATVLCIGLNSEWESESYDRADIRLPGCTDDLVRAVLAADPNAIIVNQSVVQAFFGGNECGNGIADVLLGKVSPSSKLPFTWPKRLEDYPAHAGFGHPTDTIYSEGLRVGYRYFDRPGAPFSLFPYGHGLSYTSFKYSNLVHEWTDDHTLEVNFDLTNIGSVAGAEAGLVFVHELCPHVSRPEVELAGFAKTQLLQPGEKTTLTVTLEVKAFSYYCTDSSAWVARKGAFEVHVGSSAVQMVLSVAVHLKDSYTWVGLHDPRKLE